MSDSQNLSVDLGRLLRKRREDMHLSQDEVAKRAGTQKQRISGIENGALPTVTMFASICNALDVSDDSTLAWALKWLIAATDDAGGGGEEERSRFCEALREEQKRGLELQQQFLSKESSRSLTRFPRDFLPLKVICGDRRESPPQTRGDLFAYSVSITDVMFLPNLRINQKDTVIRSDKLLINMSDDYLRKEFGSSNLLVIGSPAVNIATRLINKTSPFCFATDQYSRDWLDDFRKETDLLDPNILEVFWHLCQEYNPKKKKKYPDGQISIKGEKKQVEKEDMAYIDGLIGKFLGDKDLKTRMNDFRKPGIVDLADYAIHGASTKHHNDFGFIGLGPNPYSDSDDYACILVAGIHGPASAQGLRALATPERFDEHPFGGVFEVTLDPLQEWPMRLEKASFRWQTKPYESSDLISNIKRLRGGDRRNAIHTELDLARDHLEKLESFIHHRAGLPDQG